MPSPRVRLKDIAGATGFSANTVSLALRGSPRIPRETRDLIVAEAKRLHYLPNQVARSLVVRATKTIGLVLPDIMSPTLMAAAKAIEQRLLAHGYGMMFTATENLVSKELKALDVFRSRQVDGILIFPVMHRRIKHLRALRQSGFPVVALAADADARLDVVSIDDRAGATTAVEHLLSLGHRRIGMLDAASAHENREKFDGYAGALDTHDIALDPALVIDPKGHSATAGYQAMPTTMAAKPTALFTSNDRLAIGALAWCRDHDVSVPGDLAIVGYDDIEAARFCSVPLTTIHYGITAVSERAVERLLALIDHRDPLPRPEIVQIAPELIVRESCGASFGNRTGRRR